MKRLAPSRTLRRLLLSVLAATACLVTAVGHASAVPATVAVSGVLTSVGGGPAADGTYQLQFAIYPKESGAPALWVEGPVGIKVEGGHGFGQWRVERRGGGGGDVAVAMTRWRGRRWRAPGWR